MLNSIQRDAKNEASKHFRRIIASASVGKPAQPGARNIIGWGIGTKTIDGIFRNGENVVRVYVRELPGPIIPKRFGNLRIDVIEIGQITAYQNRDRYRPVVCGVSIGHPNIDAGTLGCLVEKEGNHYILSNNHILANSNKAIPGDPVIQPGRTDGGVSPDDNIATLEPYKEIDFSSDFNNIDAAIARVGDTNQTLVRSEIVDIGTPISTPCPVYLGQIVRKSGRTTGHTIGVVEDISADLSVDYGDQSAWFENQIVVKGVASDSPRFSDSGDSGSLLVDKQTLEPVALLFAGNEFGFTVANPIDLVLDYYGVTVVGTKGADA